MDNAYSPKTRGKMLALAALSILLAVSFLAVIPAGETVAVDGQCGDDLTWTVTQDGKKITLSIEGCGNMWDFESEEDVPWNEYRDSITDVVLTSELSSIGSYAFKDFTEVSGTIVINERITNIGTQAFRNCSFQAISVDSNNVNYKSDANGILYNYSMTAIIQAPTRLLDKPFTVPATVTAIEPYAFMYCKIGLVNVSSYIDTIGENAFKNTTFSVMTFGTLFSADLSNCGLSFYENDESTPATSVNGWSFNLVEDKMVKKQSRASTYTVSYTNCQQIEPNTEVVDFPIVLPAGDEVVYGSKVRTFNGWLTKDGSSVGEIYTGNSDIELTADWIVTVRFDSDGGSAVEPLTGKPTTWVEKPTPDPTKTDLTFQKWVIIKEGKPTEDVVWPYTLDEDIEFTAVWKVQVKYDTQGGNEIPSVMLDIGGKIDMLPTPEKAGFAFRGWFDSPSGSKEITTSTSFYKSSTIYALWTAGTFTIQFICEGENGFQLFKEEQTVKGGSIINKPTAITFTVKGTTYYIEEWIGFTDGMIATEDRIGENAFFGKYMRAIDIKDSIEGKSCTYTSDSDSVYILSTSFKKMTEKAKSDAEFTYTIVLNNGSITFNSTFLKTLKASDRLVAIYKMTEDIPEEVKKKAGTNPMIYTVVFGNETTLASPLVIKLNYAFTEKQEKERLCIFSITADGSQVNNLNGSPSKDGITFESKNLLYFWLKYDSMSYLIKYWNEDKLFYYYLVEKEQLIPVPVSTPTKEPTVQYEYEFIEWNGYTPGMKAFTNNEFKAVYEPHQRVYTVKYMCEAKGQIVELSTKQMVYGSKVTAPSDKSIVIAGTTFEIASWPGIGDKTTVTGDMTFFAEMKEAASTSWIYIIICIAAIFLIAEGLYIYNKKYRD